jgi:hypothetical protein
MEIQIKTSGLPAAKTLRAHASARIGATLGRFGHMVQRSACGSAISTGRAAVQTSCAES